MNIDAKKLQQYRNLKVYEATIKAFSNWIWNGRPKDKEPKWSVTDGRITTKP